MLSLLIILQTVWSQSPSRVLNPTTLQLQEFITSSTYEIGQDYSLILQYTKYPGVYGIELNKTIFGGSIKQQPNATYDPFTLPGCYPYDRRLIYKGISEINPSQAAQINDTNIYTSMYVKKNIVYVIRDDFILFVIEIIVDKEERSITRLATKGVYNFSNFTELDLNGTTALNNEQNIICSDKYSYCFVFSSIGSFKFSTEGPQIKDYKMLSLKNSRFPQSIYLDDSKQLLFVCYGNEGVDIYAVINSGELDYRTSLTIEGGSYIQAKTNEEGSKLFVLDQLSGLYIYDIVSQQDFVKADFFIQVLNSQRFDFYKNTFFIIAETQDELPYALEVLVNFESSNYYLNQRYSKDMEIYDVYVGEYYAVLIGSEIHRVIFHSTYNKFINQNEIPLYFEDFDLVNVEEFDPEWDPIYNKSAIDYEPFSKAAIQYKQAFMVGLSENQISIFAIKNIPPWIQCKATEFDKTDYKLVMNATGCVQKEENNDYSPFTQCVIQHNFSFQAKKVIFFDRDFALAIIIGSSLGALILILLVLVICCRKYLQNKINKMQLEIEGHVKLEENQDIQENYIV